jgi:thiamine-monophosphate kinase
MPSKNLNISDFGEKKLIKRLLSRSQKLSFKSTFFDQLSIKSWSDDAALLDFGDNYLVVTSDLLLESAHFPEKMNFRQIGRKIVTVNASDLAAMGSEAIGIILAMGLPRNMLIADFDEMVEGILQACQKYQMVLIGGDTNESAELTLCGTCIGVVPKDKVMMKSGAEEGDVVAVTGSLGLAAAGFEVLFDDKSKLKDLNPDFKDRILKHALEPEARLEKGVLLGKTGTVTSATDITDGLISEIGEIIDAGQGNVGITLYEDMIPVPPEVGEIAEIMDKNPLEMALYYGEDFELLLTIKKDHFMDLKDPMELHQIGYVDSSSQITMINKDGKTEIITPHGYEHFKNPGKYQL